MKHDMMDALCRCNRCVESTRHLEYNLKLRCVNTLSLINYVSDPLEVGLA